MRTYATKLLAACNTKCMRRWRTASLGAEGKGRRRWRMVMARNNERSFAIFVCARQHAEGARTNINLGAGCAQRLITQFPRAPFRMRAAISQRKKLQFMTWTREISHSCYNKINKVKRWEFTTNIFHYKTLKLYFSHIRRTHENNTQCNNELSWRVKRSFGFYDHSLRFYYFYFCLRIPCNYNPFRIQITRTNKKRTPRIFTTPTNIVLTNRGLRIAGDNNAAHETRKFFHSLAVMAKWVPPTSAPTTNLKLLSSDESFMCAKRAQLLISRVHLLAGGRRANNKIEICHYEYDYDYPSLLHRVYLYLVI